MGLMGIRRMMMESGPHEMPQYETAGPADIVTFESNWAMPMRSLKVAIDPVQDLSHGDPSPENICPISGWTEVDVEQSGKNVWDEEWLNGYYDTSGNFVSSANYVCSKNMVRFDDNETLYLVAPVPLTIRLYDENKNYLGSAPSTWRNETIKPTTYQPNARYLHFFNAASGSMTTYNHDISINYPSSDHDYHPYTGRSITINLGQTVYGGKLDVLSGELVVDRANIASYNGETLPGTWISDRDVYAQGATPTTGAQVVYELATPIVYHLTPTEVRTLLGQNNVWADTGDSTVEYYADTKRYIDKKIAELINS